MPEVYHIVSPESDFVLCSCGSIMVDVTARGMERRQYRCLHCGNVANEPETPNSRARILPPEFAQHPLLDGARHPPHRGISCRFRPEGAESSYWRVDEAGMTGRRRHLADPR